MSANSGSSATAPAGGVNSGFIASPGEAAANQTNAAEAIA
jgi:hypothetical protein